MASSVDGIHRRSLLARFLFETRGQTVAISARIYLNKLVYVFVRSACKRPVRGWLHSPLYWFHFPLSLRGKVLWSPPLQAWFCPEHETALEYMIRLESYEPVDWVQPSEGQTFIDVGGYIGSYSISAARAVGPAGRVLILEPEPNNRRQLERNLQLNGITNCTILPLAAWSASGLVGWHQDDQPVWHKVEERQNGQTMNAVSIDDLVDRLAIERVDWIKMDIEGAEVGALKGAQKTLKKYHPQLFIEVHETLKEVSELLSHSGYSVIKEGFDIQPERHGWILARPS